MAFTDAQVRQLRAKLDAKHVKTRKANGISLHYVEGWHAIAEANRIFGYDAWDRRTLTTNCVWTAVKAAITTLPIRQKCASRVRAGDMTIIREGSGTGEASAPTPGQAHELALKGAETDATKRALATFGNPFGLALYDRELTGVRKARRAPVSTADDQTGPWVLRSGTGAPVASHENTIDFIEALRQAMSEAGDIELLYEVWQRNLEAVRAVHRISKDGPGVVPTLVAHLRACAVALVKGASHGGSHPAPEEAPINADKPRCVARKIDKSVLTFGEPKRIRCKEHLCFVARQPCVICGRSPSHAHHVRYAQSRGLSLKVSDEFTVPLCAIHHHHIHTTGKEQEWWQERNIDPLAIARCLWQESCKRGEHTPADQRDTGIAALST